MKNLILLLCISGFIGSCTYAPHRSYSRSTSRTSLPPGHAKKAYGTKSAKPFAPGQQKKHR
ncbi:MAG: hypothetical protein WC716_11325 [Chitinophagaceae bacterium]